LQQAKAGAPYKVIVAGMRDTVDDVRYISNVLQHVLPCDIEILFVGHPGSNFTSWVASNGITYWTSDGTFQHLENATNYATHLIAFWDNLPGYVQYTIGLAQTKNLVVNIAKI